jgi:tetratricopeptide (TPR) repeat protein
VTEPDQVRLFNQEQYKQSAASFELALHSLGGGYIYAPYLYKYLGTCLLALSRHKAAEEVLSEGALLFPFFTDLFVLRGELYLQLGRNIEAAKDLEVCLMHQNTPNICVPKPEIERAVMVNMLEEIRASHEETTVTV